MARIRSIKPEACHGERLGRVSSDAERLFWRLQTHCDDHGRCEDSPRIIHGACVPLVDGWTHETVDELLWELAEVDADRPLIWRYVDPRGRELIEVENWSQFQSPRHPKPSLFAPYEMTARRTRFAPNHVSPYNRADLPSTGSISPEDRADLPSGVEGSGEGEERSTHEPRVNLREPVDNGLGDSSVAEALALVADRQLAERSGSARPDLAAAGIRARLRDELADDLAALAADHPDWSPERLADELVPLPERTVDPTESEVLARAERDRGCETCGGRRCGGLGVFELDPDDRDTPMATCADVPYQRLEVVS